MNTKIISTIFLLICLFTNVNSGPVAGAACCTANCLAIFFTGIGYGGCVAACIASLGVAGLIPGICVAAFAAPTL